MAHAPLMALILFLLATAFTAHAAVVSDKDILEAAFAAHEARSGPDKANYLRLQIEQQNTHADEATRLQNLDTLIHLAAGVLQTRDRTIDPHARLGIWPDFDARPFGAKPLFAGTDPASIADPIMRRAYEDVLAWHQHALANLPYERQKEDAANAAFAASSALSASLPAAQATARVRQTLATLPRDSWLLDRITTQLPPDIITAARQAPASPPGPLLYLAELLIFIALLLPAVRFISRG